jgi:hypothetical protein
MKTFEELKKEITLKIYIESELGTMYTQKEASILDKSIIRHFDSEVTPEFIPLYVHLYKEVQNWIESRPSINEFVFMPNLIETGKDYIIRPFYVIFISNDRYIDGYEPIAPPANYYGMINNISYELSNELPEDYDEENYIYNEENIIHRIIRKSLLGCTTKTFYDDDLEKFIIVEPKISLTDLEEWKKIVESKE